MAAPPVGNLPARHPPPAPPADRARHARRGQGPRNRRAPLDADGETRARPPHPRHPRRRMTSEPLSVRVNAGMLSPTSPTIAAGARLCPAALGDVDEPGPARESPRVL